MITQLFMGFATNMAPRVSEGILRAEHENITSRQVIKKKGVETPKNSFF